MTMPTGTSQTQQDTQKNFQKLSGLSQDIQTRWEAYQREKTERNFVSLFQESQKLINILAYQKIPHNEDIREECKAEVSAAFFYILERHQSDLSHFSTYLAIRTRGIMKDCLEKERRHTTSLSRTIESRLRDINNIRGQYGQNLTPTEIAEKIIESNPKSYWRNAETKEIHPPDTILKMVRTAINKSSHYLKLNHPISEDGPDLIETTSGDTSIYLQPDEALETEQDITILHHLISNLDERAQDIIRGKYFEGISLVDIGEKWGISESRACQIHKEFLEKLNDI